MINENEAIIESAEPVSVGLQLRSAREVAGFSIEDIANLTFIRPDVIRDLENDRFESAGGIAYARGHIRTIAKIVHLDADALIHDFALLTGDFDRPMIDLLTENKVTTPHREFPKISYKAMSAVAAAVVAGLILVPAIGSFTDSSPKKDPVATAPQASSDAGDLTAVATKSSDVVVVLTGVNGQTWVGITDASGNQIFSGRVVQDEVKTFTDNQLLYFVIGNAGAVNLNVNGEDLGTPGAVGEVLHLQFAPGQSSQG
ncbi:unannotated protein [freshwater metagenome]|uniref:Unannotated protein n=1 Tax=freshwater metagenome TaxID=449393 RepID=A0A6J7F3U3_9ZZZZ